MCGNATFTDESNGTTSVPSPTTKTPKPGCRAANLPDRAISSLPRAQLPGATARSRARSLRLTLRQLSPRQFENLADVGCYRDLARVDLHRTVAERALGNLVEVLALDADIAQRRRLTDARDKFLNQLSGWT